MKNILCFFGFHNYEVTGVSPVATFHQKHNHIYTYYCKCKRKNCGKAKEFFSKFLKNVKPTHKLN